MSRSGRRALAIAIALLAVAPDTHADEPEPVFPGHPDLTRYTKEFALEATGSLTEDGPALGGGATVSALYTPWLASFAGATFSPDWTAPRERWEARGGGRLIYPEPLFANVFGYVLGGGGLLFTAASGQEATFRRSLTGIAGLGLFMNLSTRLRLRLEVREHVKLYGRSDTSHTETVGLSLIFLAR